MTQMQPFSHPFKSDKVGNYISALAAIYRTAFAGGMISRGERLKQAGLSIVLRNDDVHLCRLRGI
jgi:hypothetical protein